MTSLLRRWRITLAQPVDAGSLAMFRIAFGAVMLAKAYKWLEPLDGRSWLESLRSGSLVNWIETVYTGPKVHWLFPYHGFEWVRPLPNPWTHWLCALMGVAGLLVALGILYRPAIVVLTAIWTYFFLLDETHYNNHYYLVILLGVLLSFMPADRAYSVGRWLRAMRDRTLGPASVPFWCVFLLRLQLFVVYFYGGLAKISYQWLVDAEPVFGQLQSPRVSGTIYELLSAVGLESWHSLATGRAAALAISYGGLVFDLAVGFLLICRRTRYFGFALGLAFHAINHFVLFDDIGLFPHLAAATMLIFFEPDWPRRFFAWLRRPTFHRPDVGWLLAGLVLFPPLGWLLGWRQPATAEIVEDVPSPRASSEVPLAWPATALVVLWTTLQLTLPLRHYFIPGDVSWTAEGERWSWRMKAGRKRLYPPRIRVVDPVLLRPDTAEPIRWSEWRGGRVVYQEVSLATLDWRSMPRWLIVFQPFYGERLLFNPWAMRPLPENYAAAVTAAMTEWKRQMGTQPKIFQTLDLPVALAAARRRLSQTVDGGPLLEAISRAQLIVQHMQRATPPEILARNLRGELHEALRPLVQHAEHGPWLRALMGRIDPFALNGAPAAAWVLGVEEDSVVHELRRAFVVLDKERLAWFFRDEPIVYVDSDRFTRWEWIAFDRVLVHRRENGRYELLWNLDADLLPLQARVMQGRPFMCHQYAQRIARWWIEEYGRRPQVYFTSYVALAPHSPQLAIDPNVDLAAARLNLWGHSDWILPWNRADEGRAATAPDPQAAKRDAIRQTRAPAR